MVNKKFSAHGNVHAHFLQEKRILSISLSGPFNLEFILKYQRLVGAERPNIQVPCWASLVKKIASGMQRHNIYQSRNITRC